MSKKEVNEELLRKQREYKKVQKRIVIENKYKRMLNHRAEKLEEKKKREIERMERRNTQLMERDIKCLQNSKRDKPKTRLLGVKEITEKERLRKYIPIWAVLLVQLYARARDSNNNGQAFCICCGVSGERKDLDGGHCYTKAESRAVRLDVRNVNAQLKKCNATRGKGGNKDAQKPRVEAKRGVGTIADLERIKRERPRTDELEFIKEYLPITYKLLKQKTCDASRNIKRCEMLAGKLNIELK